MWRRVVLFLILLSVSEVIILPSLFEMRFETSQDSTFKKMFTGFSERTVVIGSSRSARGISTELWSELSGNAIHNFSFPGSDTTWHEYLIRRFIEFSWVDTIYLHVDPIGELTGSGSLTWRDDLIRDARSRLTEWDKDYFATRGLSYETWNIFSCDPRTFDLRGKVDYLSKRNASGDMLIEGYHECDANDENFYFPALREIKKLCSENGVYLVTFNIPDSRNRFEFLRKEDYYDCNHLNAKGAESFTEYFLKHYVSNHTKFE